jgi:hypothetical protein
MIAFDRFEDECSIAEIGSVSAVLVAAAQAPSATTNA